MKQALGGSSSDKGRGQSIADSVDQVVSSSDKQC